MRIVHNWRGRIRKLRILTRSGLGRQQLLETARRRLRGRATPSQVLGEATTPRNLATLEAARVVVTLGVPDLVASGVSSVDELAIRVNADADALARVLRHLIERGLFRETAPGRVALTPAGTLLRTGVPGSRNAAFRLGVQYFDAALREMLYSVRTGKPAFERVNGAPAWQLMATNPDLAASFDNQMNARSRSLAAELLGSRDWTGVSHVVDVGGGNGQLLRLLLRELPGRRGTLVEYTDVAERAKGAVASDQSVASRCEVVEADFFTGVPRGGNLYILSSIIHDWDDERAARILANCAEALPAGGRVLVIEKPVDVSPDTELDLRMLVFYGGRERSRVEYEVLARRGGMSTRSWTELPSGFWVMDCERQAEVSDGQ